MRPWLRSTGAVAAGFITTAVASIGTDALMHALKIFPDSPADMSGSLFALASAYRAIFAIAGGYVTVRLAADRPGFHASLLAAIGFVAGLAGVIAYYVIGGANLGPAWYAISIPVAAIPCVLLGARLAMPPGHDRSHRSPSEGALYDTAIDAQRGAGGRR